MMSHFNEISAVINQLSKDELYALQSMIIQRLSIVDLNTATMIKEPESEAADLKKLRCQAATKRILEISQASNASSGKKRWTREESKNS
jgi:hypothetical protein